MEPGHQEMPDSVWSSKVLMADGCPWRGTPDEEKF